MHMTQGFLRTPPCNGGREASRHFGVTRVQDLGSSIGAPTSLAQLDPHARAAIGERLMQRVARDGCAFQRSWTLISA
jgi:hypothetical protein